MISSLTSVSSRGTGRIENQMRKYRDAPIAAYVANRLARVIPKGYEKGPGIIR